MRKKNTQIPVIDLFAVPSGLGKEISRATDSYRNIKYKIYLSIKRDSYAHQTLELRSIFYKFKEDKVPASRNRKDSLVDLRDLVPSWLSHEWRAA